MSILSVMKTYRYRTLSRDLIFWLTITISTVVAVLAGAYYTYSTILAQKELESSADTTTAELAKVLVQPLWNLDAGTIEQISRAYLSTDFMVGIKVGTDYDVLFESMPEDMEDVLVSNKKIAKGGDAVGVVEVIYTTKSIKQTQETMIRTMIVIIISVLLIVILGTQIIMRFTLNKPLAQLIEGIKTIAHGEYQHPLLSVPQTDINAIVSEVNVMTRHIEKREEELKLLNQALEARIAKQRQAEKQLAESEKLYRGIFQNALEGIYQSSSDGKFIGANPTMARILGYGSPEDLIEGIIDISEQIFVSKDKRAEFLTILNEKNSVENFECQFYRKDNTIIWVSNHATAIKNDDGRIIRIEGLLEDISERKRAEDAIQNAYTNLERRVDERTAALKTANDELQKAKETADAATEAKSEFLANMSHEIRTPMNGVISAADLAMGEELSPKVNQYLKIIHNSGHSLLGIINDILDFSKIEAGQLDLEDNPFRINSTLDKVSDIFASKAAEKGVELLVDVEPGTPMAVIGDALRLQQIITNLAGNSIKFTDSGGTIAIGVKELEKTMESVLLEFYVKDTGIGMKQTYLENLFEPFTQADASTTRKYGGTGLGLTISKQLIENMNGEVRVESEYGVGTTFFFTVKLQRQPSGKEIKLNMPDDLAELRVLVADDDADSRIIMAKILRSFGLGVDTVESGDIALEVLREQQTASNPYGLFISDWLMPGKDGLETASTVRNDLNLKIPIIIMTAFGREAEITDHDKDDIQGFLTKPIIASSLFDAIMDVFGKDQLKIGGKAKITTKASVYKNKIKGAKVLVAEDNLTNQQIAIAILNGAGIDVQIANNGKEAVDMINGNYYDLILMDMQMPEMDGYEATGVLRKNPAYRDLPIIAMTAHAMKGDEEKCLDAGMNGYVTKPINQDRLFQVMWEHLKKNEGFVNASNEDAAQPVAAAPEPVVAEMPEPIADEPGPAAEATDEEDYSVKLPDNLPGMRIKEAKDALSLDDNIFRSILSGFLKNSKNCIQDISSAFDAGDWAALCEHSHSVKGSGSNVGAHILQEVAQTLELASAEVRDNPDAPPPTADMVKKVIEALEVVFKSLLLLEPKAEEESSADAAEIDVEKAAPILSKLIEAIEMSNPSEIKIQMAEATNFIGNSLIRQIKDSIDMYDYDEAIQAISDFAGENSIEIVSV